MNLQSESAPNPVDVHVGLKIKLRRKQLGYTQERLAEGVGITFQQIQKYERATNRVSASKLVEIARVLEAPVSFFFDGLSIAPDLAAEAVAEAWTGPARPSDGELLLRAFEQIASPRLQRQVLDLVLTLSEQDATRARA